jgi:hypothetical protein
LAEALDALAWSAESNPPARRVREREEIEL